MPEIGEFKRGREIGKYPTLKYVWHACRTCGKGRWVQFNSGSPVSLTCSDCKVGSNSQSWKGGRKISDKGYVFLYLTGDDFFYPMCGKAHYVMEHRLVMAKHLCRCLARWELVHHKNGIKDDNRIENLELTTNSQHLLDHSKGYKAGYAKGLIDGKDKRVSELEKRVTLLEAENALLKTHTVSRFG
jgi:hypothetical protein